MTDRQKVFAKHITNEIAPVRVRSDGKPDVATQAHHFAVLTGVTEGLRRSGYVADLTCVLHRKRRWFGQGEDTVICGRATVEQYLRQGYVFDWGATDRARGA